jgi:multisubunit Na+/H+ antiporter MnhC subunit
MSLASIIILVILGLVGIGLYALLITRNLIKVVIGLQMMVKGAILALVLAGRLSGQVNLGQSLALTVVVADTIVAVIALALAVQIRRHCGTLDLNDLATLRR